MNEIYEAKQAYDALFSSVRESELGMIYKDSKLLDMYHHNFAFVIRNPEEVKEQLLVNVRALGDDQALNVFLHPSIRVSDTFLQEMRAAGADVSTLLYMVIDTRAYERLAGSGHCLIRRAEERETIADAVSCLQTIDSVHINQEFAERKVRRKAEVYEKKQLNVYICYVDETAVGMCEWFQWNGIVRAEEFSIMGEHQRKGYGTAMMKQMIRDAQERGASHLFVTTYKDDTTQDMYRKFGFIEIGEQVQLFWRKSSDAQ